ncbi:MAG: ABC transporter ATP-binding protein [Alphaproteobacteria bacterium]|nr:ABC transporter ATP-binding protein [Alphaproteobacteria bacterium]
MRPLLRLEGVEAGYGTARVLNGVSFDIGASEVVALMGRNGMGKTTLVRAILGLAPWVRGRVLFDGRELRGHPTFRIARAGIGLVPEGRQVFPNLTVRENLDATAANRAKNPAPWTIDRVVAMLPQLAARMSAMASTLSGGEQQMLSIGRALMTNPALLVLDEATEGLSPALRAEIWQCLATLRRQGQSILLIDKHVAAMRGLADRIVILEKGRVAWRGTPDTLTDDVLQRTLGV